MRKIGIIFAVLLFIVVVVQAVVIVALLISGDEFAGLSGDKIVVVRIDDIIIDPSVFLKRFEPYRDREDVKAIILRMETPGGTVAGSQELARAVERMRTEDSKVVVTSIVNLGASGGYYIAAQSNAIVANPGSLVGSIGVILEHMNLEEISAKIGVKYEAITSGKMKDAGSPLRAMRPEERKVLQDLVNNAYQQFRGSVLEGRWEAIAAAAGVLNEDSAAIEAKLDSVADGRILTGEQALEAGLVDELGDLERAIELAESLSGAEDAEVIYHVPEEDLFSLEKMLGGTFGSIFGAVQTRHSLMPGGLWYFYE